MRRWSLVHTFRIPCSNGILDPDSSWALAVQGWDRNGPAFKPFTDAALAPPRRAWSAGKVQCPTAGHGGHRGRHSKQRAKGLSRWWLPAPSGVRPTPGARQSGAHTPWHCLRRLEWAQKPGGFACPGASNAQGGLSPAARGDVLAKLEWFNFTPRQVLLNLDLWFL